MVSTERERDDSKRSWGEGKRAEEAGGIPAGSYVMKTVCVVLTQHETRHFRMGRMGGGQHSRDTAYPSRKP